MWPMGLLLLLPTFLTISGFKSCAILVVAPPFKHAAYSKKALQTTTLTTQVLEVFTVYLTTQVIIHKEGPTFSFNGLFCCVLLVFFKVPLAARVRFHATITICDDGIIQLGPKTGLTPVIVHIVHLSIRTIFLFPLKVLIWKHTLKMY